MSENFDGPKVERGRILVIDRFPRDEMDMAITDLSLTNPQFPQDGSYETWLQKTFIYLNSKRQLGKLFVELAKRMGAPEDSDACELLKLVEAAKVPQDAVRKLETSNQIDDTKVEAKPETESAQVQLPTLPKEITIPPRPRRSRIILLGEATALSVEDLGESRKKVASHLTEALRADGIAVVDWGDRWNTRGAPPAAAEDADALFMRVVNEDILTEEVEQLTALPQKLAQKLKLERGIDELQIVIWNSEIGRDPVAPAVGGEQPELDRTEVKARLGQLLLAEGPLDKLAAVLRPRLGLERWPPTLHLEHPGDANTLIQKKLIEVIRLSTAGKCEPPDPEVDYFEVTSMRPSDLTAELKDLVSQDAARDGAIIAIHDLNLSMTDDRKEALMAVNDRLLAYDRFVSEIAKQKSIPENKIVKLAILMATAKCFARGYTWSWKHEDWAIVALKKDKELAEFEQSGESLIKKKIDALVGAE